MATLHMIDTRYSVAVVTGTTYVFSPMMESVIYITSSDLIKASVRKGEFVQKLCKRGLYTPTSVHVMIATNCKSYVTF